MRAHEGTWGAGSRDFPTKEVHGGHRGVSSSAYFDSSLVPGSMQPKLNCQRGWHPQGGCVLLWELESVISPVFKAWLE